MTKLLKIASVALLATGLTSCLKDKNIEDQKYGMAGAEDLKVIELASDESHANVIGLDFVNRDTIINFAVVRLAAKDPAPEDIKVTLTLASSSALISDYNAEHGSTFIQFPSSLYTLQGGGLTVTIPKGSREGYVQLKVNPSTFNPSEIYALGFKIASVDKQGYTISQNFGSFITAIGAKNKYDGVYQITSGTLVDANGVYIGYYPGTPFYDPSDPRIYELATVSGTSGVFYDLWFPYANYIVVNGTTGGFANTGIRPQFTFDAVTDKLVSGVSVGTTAGTLTIDPTSRFNPSDRSIDVKWSLGRWTVTEHWKYLRAR